MPQTILTVLLVFIIPIPLWLMLFHFVSIKKKSFASRILVYLSLGLFWAVTAYLGFTDQELLFKYQFVTHPIIKVFGGFLLLLSLVIDFFIMKQLGVRRLICLAELKENNTSETLVTHGIYKYARHPRYGEYMLFCFGIGLVTGYFSYLLAALYLCVGLYICSYVEEKELVARFGEAYEAYQKKVPRFFFSLS